MVEKTNKIVCLAKINLEEKFSKIFGKFFWKIFGKFWGRTYFTLLVDRFITYTNQIGSGGTRAINSRNLNQSKILHFGEALLGVNSDKRHGLEPAT